MNVLSISNMQWANPEHTYFDCTVVFAEIGETLPFACNTAELNRYDHVQKIWDMAHSGEFGEIAEFVPPPEPDPDAPIVTAAPSSGSIPGSIL